MKVHPSIIRYPCPFDFAAAQQIRQIEKRSHGGEKESRGESKEAGGRYPRIQQAEDADSSTGSTSHSHFGQK